MTASPPLHTLRVCERPPRTWAQVLNAVSYGVAFNVACMMINGFQFMFLLPLKLLPFTWARTLYDEGVRYTKGCFGCLLVLMCQWFAPTELVITFEREGTGRISEEQINKIIVRDAGPDSDVVALNLPLRTVLIANHQVYSDWWYAWCLTYFMGTHKDVLIVLKKSLKWAPVVGWGMQFFNFIFLARSWASDRVYLASRLSRLGKQAEQHDKPLTFILYPEGTLVSELTRPLSKKYADKMGIPDTLNTLLPRSTGLLHSLRSLAPRIPALQLIDITVAYPGIPPMGYGQSYYTLRSIFFDRVPPPSIHMHIRLFDIAKNVPIGDLSKTNPEVVPERSSQGSVVEVETPEEEKAKFDLWLRELWYDKDRLFAKFHETGSFTPGVGPEVRIPLRLKRTREIFDSFCFFVPAALGYFSSWIRCSLS